MKYKLAPADIPPELSLAATYASTSRTPRAETDRSGHRCREDVGVELAWRDSCPDGMARTRRVDRVPEVVADEAPQPEEGVVEVRSEFGDRCRRPGSAPVYGLREGGVRELVAGVTA